MFSAKVLSAAEQGKPIFKSKDPKVTPVLGNKRFNQIALLMTAFGGLCMCLSNWLESKKVVTEWQLGAGKLQRKANIAESKQGAAEDTDHPTTAGNGTLGGAESPASKNWTASVQTGVQTTAVGR